jgi:Spy/CpxP family protein refolding chaperone
MKKIFYFLIVLLTVSFAVPAQPDGGGNRQPNMDPPRIMGLKVAYVTKQLALTNDEAQKFWPVYYSYAAEMKKTKGGSKEDVIALEESMLNVRKKYRTEFKRVLLTDERVNKALTVDRDFSNVVRKELMQRANMRAPKQKRQAEGQN